MVRSERDENENDFQSPWSSEGSGTVIRMYSTWFRLNCKEMTGSDEGVY